MHAKEDQTVSPKGYQVVGMFRDQSPSTNSIEIIYKTSYNETTVNILVLILTGLYVLIRYTFSEMTGEELSTSVKEIWVSARSRRMLPEDTILIEHPEKMCWGESRKINKTSLVSQITGYKPRISSFKDEVCMKAYLEKILKSTLPILKISTLKEFLPESAPLLDFLVAESRALEGWKYPLQEELKNFRNKGDYHMIC